MEEKQSRKELVKRYAVLTVGLYLMALSVRLTVVTAMGTSPISTIPNVMSCYFTQVSLGVHMFIWNMTLLLLQLLILRKNFRPIQLLQIPLSFLFSAMLDFNGWLLRPLQPQTFVMKFVVLAAGCLLLGFSVFLTVRADVVMNAGEGIVKAIADTFHFEFGYVKVALDVLYVVVGFLLSYLFFHELRGVGVGTLLLAVFTGFVVKFFQDKLGNAVDRFLEK